MSSSARTAGKPKSYFADADADLPDIAEAEAVLLDLARVFADSPLNHVLDEFSENGHEPPADAQAPNLEAKYRALLEQIPAVVFMAHLDRGISEAYVSPQIEAVLGYSREEWLEDPVRWYQHIHPHDKQRWSLEAAEMFLSGKPLPIRLSSDCAGWPRYLVSLRCPHDAAGRRPALVYSWGCV